MADDEQLGEYARQAESEEDLSERIHRHAPLLAASAFAAFWHHLGRQRFPRQMRDSSFRAQRIAWVLFAAFEMYSRHSMQWVGKSGQNVTRSGKRATLVEGSGSRLSPLETRMVDIRTKERRKGL